jgi:hypothetical protein
MRQAGVIAAPGIVALTEQVQKLAQDHSNAKCVVGADSCSRGELCLCRYMFSGRAVLVQMHALWEGCAREHADYPPCTSQSTKRIVGSPVLRARGCPLRLQAWGGSNLPIVLPPCGISGSDVNSLCCYGEVYLLDSW